MRKINLLKYAIFRQKYGFARMTPELVAAPYWAGHIPFAFPLVKALSPRVIVELGVYNGTSFAAFCQAVKKLGLKTVCYGIDTWEGDVHMGKMNGSVYPGLLSYCRQNYGAAAVLLRKTFDEASKDFADGSIDLLHIDGTHTYDAVKKDFETWLPKVSPRGAVVFHDVNVTRENLGPSADDYGVGRLFDSLKNKYPSIEFKHSYGLGVLFTGTDVPGAAIALAADSEDLEFLRYFRRYGNKAAALYRQPS